MSIKLDKLIDIRKKYGCRQIGETNLKIPSGSIGLSESFLNILCVNIGHLPV